MSKASAGTVLWPSSQEALLTTGGILKKKTAATTTKPSPCKPEPPGACSALTGTWEFPEVFS